MCKNVDCNKLFNKCKKQAVRTTFKMNENGDCVGGCWESKLCNEYKWYSSQGNFNKVRARGTAYFVYPEIDNKLTLWGISSVKKIDGGAIYFSPFKPLPVRDWIRDIQPLKLFNQHWKSGTYRYLNEQLEEKLNSIILAQNEYFDDPVETVLSDMEGRRILVEHLVKERSTKLVASFKKKLKDYNCWVCGFNFENKYGEIGKNFIEAHHIIPVSSLKENQRISINDFAALCSNCHRMVHKTNPPIDWEDLKRKLMG